MKGHVTYHRRATEHGVIPTEIHDVTFIALSHVTIPLSFTWSYGATAIPYVYVVVAGTLIILDTRLSLDSAAELLRRRYAAVLPALMIRLAATLKATPC